MRRFNPLRFLKDPATPLWRRLACLAIGLGLGLIALAAAGIGTAVHLENQDTFCASCHTEPETTYVQRAQASEPVDLAAAHASYESATRCIDCHSGPGLKGRAGALYQGAQDVLAFISGAYHQPTIMENPLGDAPCLKCHVQPSRDNPVSLDDNPQVIASNSHYHWVEYTHAWLEAVPNPQGTCSTCHPAHNDQTKAVLGFRDMQATNAACDACHQALSGQLP